MTVIDLPAAREAAGRSITVIVFLLTQSAALAFRQDALHATAKALGGLRGHNGKPAEVLAHACRPGSSRPCRPSLIAISMILARRPWCHPGVVQSRRRDPSGRSTTRTNSS